MFLAENSRKNIIFPVKKSNFDENFNSGPTRARVLGARAFWAFPMFGPSPRVGSGFWFI